MRRIWRSGSGSGARAARSAGTAEPAGSTVAGPRRQPSPASRGSQVAGAEAASGRSGPTGSSQRASWRGPSFTASAGKSTRSRAVRTAAASPAVISSQAPLPSTSTSARARSRPVGLMQQVRRQAPAGASTRSWLLCPCRKRRVSGPSRRSRLTGCSRRRGPAGRASDQLQGWGCRGEGDRVISGGDSAASELRRAIRRPWLDGRRRGPPPPAGRGCAAPGQPLPSLQHPPPGDPRSPPPGPPDSPPPAAGSRP